ncbi:hypothetical protein [Cytobacillus gottheilii]|uniref:Uncharacterized protein n=1 Tax=Cytobacillus gottheilii TaxID=859144 RepID=A0ABX8FGC1_9BACI|nr:hypothetical protein [Cytobacillus gottheilii]QVY63071.1 hypothetical protein J1899_08515 [Cytobacillus gottheilii]
MKLGHRKSFACYLLISLHIFLAVGALIGGGALLIFPDGSILSLPLEILQNSPFQNYFLPGLILFSGFGILPIITALFLSTKKPIKAFEKLSIYKSMHGSWNFSCYIGLMLIIWIMVQILIMQSVEFIHIFYILLGFFIIMFTFLPSVKSFYLID